MSNLANEVIWHSTPAIGTAGVKTAPQAGEAHQATSVTQTDVQGTVPMPHTGTVFKSAQAAVSQVTTHAQTQN